MCTHRSRPYKVGRAERGIGSDMVGDTPKIGRYSEVRRHYAVGSGDNDGSQEQAAQVPKISTVWLMSVKPLSAAMRAAQRSTGSAWTSTVVPHSLHTR